MSYSMSCSTQYLLSPTPSTQAVKTCAALALLVSAFTTFDAYSAAKAPTDDVYNIESHTIKRTTQSVLLDGRCGDDEWDAATRFYLPAEVTFYLMHDDDYFYICAAGKAEDYTVLDLYIQHTTTQRLHHFHLSAQMGEHIWEGNAWSESDQWRLNGYAGFWVPFFGAEETEDGCQNLKFARGTHRQVQVSRDKFGGDAWNIMLGVSSVKYRNASAEFFYPKNAQPTDAATWATLRFSK